MPHHKSCKKRMITADKARVANKQMKSRISTAAKKVLGASSKEAATGALEVAFSVIDKAVKTNVIHRKNGDNKKSRLSLAAAKIA